MPKFDPQKHHRKSIRLKNYDYSSAGAYYVTIVTWRRDILFGEVVNGEMKLNQAGKMVKTELLELEKRLSYVQLGAFIIMPNHVHVIIFILTSVGATRLGLSKTNFIENSLQKEAIKSNEGSPLPHGPKPASLGTIISQFKSRATKRLWNLESLKNTPIWQRNYYEHIIRDEKDLQNKTDYIEANPMLWDEDDENPININP
jgi:REP element-mobilizing transposase RayT